MGSHLKAALFDVLMRFNASPADVEDVDLRGLARGIQRIPDMVRPSSESAFLRCRELLDDGASYGETARTVGVDRSTVIRWFPNRGWAPHGGSSIFIRKAQRELEGL